MGIYMEETREGITEKQPLSFKQYRHYKGKRYIVLGVASHLWASDPCPAYFTEAIYTESKEDVKVKCKIGLLSCKLNNGFWGNGNLF